MSGRNSTARTDRQRLSGAVAALPRSAREAMLDAVRHDALIAGAYVGPGGAGHCPMVAVHRRGVRVDANRFARAWDAHCGAVRGRAQHATERQLRSLEALLCASLAADDDVDGGALGDAVAEHRSLRRVRHARDAVDFAAAVGEHQALARARRAREASRTGLAWLGAAAASPVTARDTRSRPGPAAARPVAARDREPALARD